MIPMTNHILKLTFIEVKMFDMKLYLALIFRKKLFDINILCWLTNSCKNISIINYNMESNTGRHLNSSKIMINFFN